MAIPPLVGLDLDAILWHLPYLISPPSSFKEPPGYSRPANARTHFSQEAVHVAVFQGPAVPCA